MYLTDCCKADSNVKSIRSSINFQFAKLYRSFAPDAMRVKMGIHLLNKWVAQESPNKWLKLKKGSILSSYICQYLKLSQPDTPTT